MSWHEPGRDRDPWRGPGEGPPDLDEWLQRARRRVAGWFGRAKRPPGASKFRLWWFVPPILIGIWLLTGFYRVPDAHKAVTLRFGGYAGATDPGLHWHWPWPIAEDRLVDMTENRSLSQNAAVLTRDGKLVTLGVTVAYRVSDPYRYLFGSAEPTRFITALANDALASVARNEDLATLQSSDASKIEKSLHTRIAAALAAADAGVSVQSVSIGRIDYPQTVTASRGKLAQIQKQNSEEAAKARDEAEQAMVAVRAKAHRLTADARQQAREREALARVRIARFEELVPAWRKSPAVTEQMLRAEAVSGVLATIPKVVVSGPIKVLTLPAWPATSAPASASAPTVATAARGGKGE